MFERLMARIETALQAYRKRQEAAGFKFEHLIQVPYSTQQYNAQMVEYAKEHKIILQLNRELVILGEP